MRKTARPRSLIAVFVPAVFAVAASVALGAGSSARNDPDAIPDLRIATGSHDIAEAWLIAPTTRYDHFVEGSRYEPGGLRVLMRDGRNITLLLDTSHVFEDRRPLLADLDGDGRDEIVLVLTSLAKGASLAVYSVSGDTIVRKAQTAYIGRPHRWLNPAGIADYDGDGRPDVALVQMPHLVKRLELWSLVDGRLKRGATIGDVANHRLGSVHSGMAATADFNGDGVADLAVPDGTRRVIRLISFAGGMVRDIARYELPAPADGDFDLKRNGRSWTLSVRLETGRVMHVTIGG
jgi:FG-GAP-like repeat